MNGCLHVVGTKSDLKQEEHNEKKYMKNCKSNRERKEAKLPADLPIDNV